MNRNIRNIGLVALAAGVLYFPVRKLFRSVAASRRQTPDKDNDASANQSRAKFAGAYRSGSLPHRRHGEMPREEE